MIRVPSLLNIFWAASVIGAFSTASFAAELPAATTVELPSPTEVLSERPHVAPFALSLHIGGALTSPATGNPDMFRSIGGSAGLRMAFFLTDWLSIGPEYEYLITISGLDPNENNSDGVAQLFQGHLVSFATDGYIPLGGDTHLKLGVRAGYGFFSGIQTALIFIPTGFGNYRSFAAGPRLGFDFNTSKSVSFGFEFSYLGIMAGTATTTGISSEPGQTMSIPYLSSAEFSLIFGFHI